MPTVQDSPANKKKPTYIARFFLPGVDPGSSLLVPDKWILQNAKEIFKTHARLRKTSLRLAGFALAGIACVAGAVAGAAAALPAVWSACVIGLAFCASQSRHAVGILRGGVLAEARAEVQVRYLKLKGSEIAAAWKENLAEKRQKTAGEQEAEAQAFAEKPSAVARLSRAAKVFARARAKLPSLTKKKAPPGPHVG